LYSINAVFISGFKLRLMRLRYFNEEDFKRRMDSTLVHELTHHAMYTFNPKSFGYTEMGDRLMNQGLCDFSKIRFAPEPELKKPEKVLDRIKLAIHDAAMEILFFSDRRKERFLKSLSEGERKARIASNPGYWVTFRLTYELGVNFISSLAEHFKNDRKLFRQVAFGRKPTMKEILEPELYIKEIE
jgi:hypothetical protein